MLETAQQTLLTALAAAARQIPATAREPFVVAPAEGRPRYLRVSHPLLTEPLEVYRGDLVALEHVELIRSYDRETAFSFVFDVTPLGQRRADDAATGAIAATTAGPAAALAPRQWGKWLAMNDKPFKTSNMSALWRVRDETDNTRTIRVLKTLRYPKGRGSAAYKRFTREIDTLARGLYEQHSGIVQVLDYSAPQEGDTREAYYVMPMASSSLKDLARDFGGELAFALRKLIPVAEALSVAHAAGVIHRDIKPDNILLFEGKPVLADFGICFLEEADRLTRTEADTVGTDDFVAPELLGGGRAGMVTPAADVYSFGKTLFAVVSGGDVFPREDYDDERFNLVQRFGRPELAHVRGLMERMVTRDPGGRPQSMAAVSQLLERALAYLNEGVAYREGMYADGAPAVARARQVRRALAITADGARRDAVRDEIAGAMRVAINCIDACTRTAGGIVTAGPESPAAAAAEAAAEEMLAVGLPLVAADDREAFAEWIGAVFEPFGQRDGQQTAVIRQIHEPAAVLAAHAAAALAWRLKRFEVLRQIVDRYAVNPQRWIHHRVLRNEASALLPWIKRSMADSEVVRWIDPALAAEPGPAASMLEGLLALRLLADVIVDENFQHFMNTPNDWENPLPFAPGFFEAEWPPELVAVGLRGGPVERDLAHVLFDRSPEQFRQLIGRLGQPLQFMHHYTRRQLNKDTFFALNTNPADWKRWTGAELPV
jgi:hypothetical protein